MNYEELSYRYKEAKMWQNILLEKIEKLETKLQLLESYCEEQKDTWESQENGDHKVYEKILTKLRS